MLQFTIVTNTYIWYILYLHDSHLDVIVSLANDQGVIFKMAQCEDDILVPFPVNHFVLISKKYFISCSQLYETCYNRLQK